VKSYYAPIDHLMLLDQLAISIAGAEAAVIRHFQKRIPYMLFVPEADAGAIEWGWRATGRPFLPGAGTQAAMEAP
jgi:hypothetical protein